MSAAPEDAAADQSQQMMAIELGARCYRLARRAWATLRLSDPGDSLLVEGAYLNALCDALRGGLVGDLDQLFSPDHGDFDRHRDALGLLAEEIGISIHA